MLANEDIMEIKDKLLERAKKHTNKLKSELKNITKLKDIIEQYLKGKETTIKTVILSELSKDLEIIIELMNNESGEKNLREEINMEELKLEYYFKQMKEFREKEIFENCTYIWGTIK